MCEWRTFECHIYSSSLPTISATSTTTSSWMMLFCNFQTHSLIQSKGFLQLHVISTNSCVRYICLYFIQIYVYTKQISPPLSFASFKFLYASMHSDVSQFCTNTTFIIVNCIPPPFSSFHTTMNECVP